MGTDTESRLAQAADRQEIYDVIMRYCRGIDRRDRELIESCYHPDGIDDHGQENPPLGSQLAAAQTTGAPRQPMSMHLIGNVYIELFGDVAFAESYCVAYLTLQPVDGKLSVGRITWEPAVAAKAYSRAAGLRYVDRFERRDGQWKIAHRIIVDDWQRIDPIPDDAPSSPHSRPSSRSSEDPSYAFREMVLSAAGASATRN